MLTLQGNRGITETINLLPSTQINGKSNTLAVGDQVHVAATRTTVSNVFDAVRVNVQAIRGGTAETATVTVSATTATRTALTTATATVVTTPAASPTAQATNAPEATEAPESTEAPEATEVPGPEATDESHGHHHHHGH